MKMKILIVPIIALLSFTISGCYTSRHNDPYYHNRESRYHRHHDRDRDRDRDDHYDRNYDHNRDYNYNRRDDDDR